MKTLPIAALLLAAACSSEPLPNGNSAEPANETAAPSNIAQPANMSASPASEDPSLLTATGWGSLRIGMTLDEVVAAAGPDANPGAVGGPDPEQCDQFRPERLPEGLLVMMVDGRLARISIIDGDLETEHGIGLGATAASVKTALGDQARVSPHKYEAPEGEYIDLWTSGASDQPYIDNPEARGIRYEVGTEGTVQAIHASGPAIQYVEGCS